MSSSEIINDMTAGQKSIDYINRHIVVFNGKDKPRYIVPDFNEAGELGVVDWGDVWNTPQYNTTASGSLTAGTYYSILVVPANTDLNVGGFPLYGNATLGSVPKTGNTGYTFDIPTDHPQYKTHVVGNATSATTGGLEDSAKAWTVDQWVGYYLHNVDTGKTEAITANTATIITASGVDFTTDDRYNLLSPFCTARLIYASAGATAKECMAGPYTLAGTIDDMTTATYDLKVYSPAADTWESNHHQPPSAKACAEVRGVLFMGGGIEETTGKARIDTTTNNSIQAGSAETGTVYDESGTVDKIEDDEQSWTTDEHVGSKLVNTDNDESVIVANNADEIFPGKAGGNSFEEGDAYYIVDHDGTPEETDIVEFVPSTTELVYANTAGTADETGTVQLKTDDTITYVDISGTADASGTVKLKTTDTISYVDVSGSPDESGDADFVTTDTISAVDTSGVADDTGVACLVTATTVTAVDVSGAADETGTVQLKTTDTITSVDVSGTPDDEQLVKLKTDNVITAVDITGSADDTSTVLIAETNSIVCGTLGIAEAFDVKAATTNTLTCIPSGVSPDLTAEYAFLILHQTKKVGLATTVKRSSYDNVGIMKDGVAKMYSDKSNQLVLRDVSGSQIRLGDSTNKVYAGSNSNGHPLSSTQFTYTGGDGGTKPSSGDWIACGGTTYWGTVSSVSRISSSYGGTYKITLSEGNAYTLEDQGGTIYTYPKANVNFLSTGDKCALGTIGGSDWSYITVSSRSAGIINVASYDEGTSAPTSHSGLYCMKTESTSANDPQTGDVVVNSSNTPVAWINSDKTLLVTLTTRTTADWPSVSVYKAAECPVGGVCFDAASNGGESLTANTTTGYISIASNGFTTGNSKAISVYDGPAWSPSERKGYLLQDSTPATIGLVTSNTRSTLTLAAHGIFAGETISVYDISESWSANQWGGHFLVEGGAVVGRITSSMNNTITLPGHGLSVSDSISLFYSNMGWTTNEWVDQFIANGSDVVIGKITANTEDTITLASHGFNNGDTFRLYNETEFWGLNAWVGQFLTNGSGVVLGRITSNTASTITVESHGLSVSDTFKIYISNTGWTNNEWKDQFLTDGAGTAIARVTSNTSDTLTTDVAHGLSATDAFKLYLSNTGWTINQWLGAFLTNGSDVVLGKITANTENTLTVASHGLSATDAFRIYESNAGWTPNEFQDSHLFSGATIKGRIESNTEDTITVTGHGLVVGNAFTVYTGAWATDEFAGFALYSGAAVVGMVESNTNDTLTLTAHGLALSAAFELYEGDWTDSALVGKFVLSTANAILGRITANTTNKLTLNAAHGLSVSNSFELHVDTVEGGTVTFPTGHKAVGESWTPNEYQGLLIRYSSLGDKTIKQHNADTIELTDGTIPGASETFEIFEALMDVSHSYSYADTDGTEIKVARYAVLGDLEGYNALPADVYAGDYITITATGEAGNNVEDIEILRVDDDRKWFEIVNDSLVEAEVDIGAIVTVTRNHISGYTSGDDQTYFLKGLKDGKFEFASDDVLEPFGITWVDEVNQRMGIDAEYAGAHANSDESFTARTNWGLYYSDQDNPHRVRAESVTEVSDKIIAIRGINDLVLMFCEYSLWKIPYNETGRKPEALSESVRCPAQGAVVMGQKYVMFYDGDGFSATDGMSVNSVTTYKARDYLDNINRDAEDGIVGVYNPRFKRFEFYFPRGSETKNNYGLFITEDSLNCYPVKYNDVRACWMEFSDGVPTVFHGTGEMGGEGVVFETEELDGTGGVYTISGVDATHGELRVTPAPTDFNNVKPFVIADALTGETTKHYAKINPISFTGESSPSFNASTWYDTGTTNEGKKVYYDATSEYAYWNHPTDGMIVSAVADVGGSPTDYFKALDYPEEITVTECEQTWVNGVYLYAGVLQGKPYWDKVGGTKNERIRWVGSIFNSWQIGRYSFAIAVSDGSGDLPEKTGWYFRGYPDPTPSLTTLSYTIPTGLQGFGSFSGLITPTNDALTIVSDTSLSGVSVGDTIISGAEVFDYGIKWTDFGSPQYRHQVRALHIELENFTGKLIVEHYKEQRKDGTAEPAQIDITDVTTDNTKITAKFRQGKCYKYGYRLRGYSTTPFKIHSMEPVFDTQA